MNESKQQWLQRMADVHGLDTEDIDEIAQMCLEDSLESLPSMKLDNTESDLTEKLRIAHSIKGSSANIGLMDLSQSAQVLETQLHDNKLDNYEVSLVKLTTELENFKTLMESE